MKFVDFKLHPDLQRGIDEAGYIDCMLVQEQVLSNAFGGHDLYVQSQTGTGKTAAFLTVVFQRMLTEEALFKRKALIMAPTRELAVQIEDEAKTLGKYLPFKAGSFYGGVGYAKQEKLLRENAQILVGTPGRVLDLNSSGKMNLMDVAFLVLDEADRMFDMGFYPDLRKLIKVVPAVDKRQTMLFSATLNAYVKNLAWEYTKSPLEIEIKPEIVTVEEIEQVLYHVTFSEKFSLLLGLLKRENPESVLIFCNTKRHTEVVAKRLRMNNIPCEFIIGDLPQVKRLKIINDLKAGKIKTLVATDVAARGLDVENLPMVINYDVPNEAENYVHRIGRTARAGKTGKAFTLASERDVYELPAIERYIGKKVPSEVAEQELYIEDLSAQKYIQTDYHEGRRSSALHSRDRHSRESRSHDSRSNDGKRKPKGGMQHRDSRESPSRKPPVVRNKKPPQGKTSEYRTREKTFEASQDMSMLTMDERMALYRKKYARTTTTPADSRADSPAESNVTGSKKKRKRKRNRRNREQAAANKVEAMGAPKHAGKQKSPAVQKGLLSKLLGIFRK